MSRDWPLAVDLPRLLLPMKTLTTSIGSPAVRTL
jgi:hypothetical protein